MSDEEASNFSSRLSKENILPINFLTPKEYKIKKSGYYYQKLGEVFSDANIGIVNFMHSKIEEINFLPGTINIKAKIEINGIEKEVDIRTRKLLHQRDPMDETLLEFVEGNLLNFDFKKNYNLTAFFILSDVKEAGITNICSSGDLDLFKEALCANIESIPLSEYSIDIEKYLTEQSSSQEDSITMDKLFFFYIVTYE